MRPNLTFSPLLDKLIHALRYLPGIGPKSAQRMAFYLLEQGKQQGLHLAEILQEAITKMGHCQRCHTFSETDLCSLCTNPKRDPHSLCVVGSPADVLAVEQTQAYRGLYFVLTGHLSPLDGIGPNEIGIPKLVERFKQADINEVILATSTTVEGEATAHYIAELAKHHHIASSRIAHGVPLGGELEFIDANTLARALAGREVM